ncbi:hypothetical protein H310_15106, partial [Aphanomyces invadans]
SLLYFCLPIVASRLQKYAAAIKMKGSMMDNVIGFIDGSNIVMCRITQKRYRAGNQLPDLHRLLYSGHKRRHFLNYQAVAAPDRLCVYFWGPIEGSRHETTLLRLSKLEECLDKNRSIFAGFLIYGNPAYGVLDWICSVYKVNELDANINSAISKVRQS